METSWPRRATAAVALLAFPALLAACTLDPYADQSPTPDETRTAGPTASPTSGVTGGAQTTPPGEPTPTRPSTADDDGAVPAFPLDTPEATGEGTGSDVGTLVDLRLGAHDGFDRVVFELEGPDIPAWRVAYVDRPVGDPSGIRVDVEGEAYLQVLLTGVAYPEDGSEPYDGPAHVTISGTTAITEAVLSSIFEGELQAFVGVEGRERGFRVYGMSDPSRVVVEVRAPRG